MQLRQGNVLQALRGVQQFLDAHKSAFPAIARSGARTQFDALVAELGEHATAQSGSDLASRGTTQRLYALRNVLLYTHMTPIVRIAAVALADTPEVAPISMPSSKSSTPLLHAAALGMADAVESHASIFIEAGLADDFINQLRAAADDMLGALNTRRQLLSQRGGATTGLKTNISRARKIVRVLDAFIRAAASDDRVLLANWDSVRRPQRKASVTGAVEVRIAEAPRELLLLTAGAPRDSHRGEINGEPGMRDAIAA